MAKIEYTDKGATFSKCGQHRYKLWRVWDNSLPMVMFIGLNPSTADAESDDPTIRNVCKIARANGYGGVYMMNCWPYISTEPKNILIDLFTNDENKSIMISVANDCKDVVFAWGNFDIVKAHGRDKELSAMFPNALALHINKNGSPKHPLYCKSDSKLIPYQQQK